MEIAIRRWRSEFQEHSDMNYGTVQSKNPPCFFEKIKHAGKYATPKLCWEASGWSLVTMLTDYHWAHCPNQEIDAGAIGLADALPRWCQRDHCCYLTGAFSIGIIANTNRTRNPDWSCSWVIRISRAVILSSSTGRKPISNYWCTGWWCEPSAVLNGKNPFEK